MLGCYSYDWFKSRGFFRDRVYFERKYERDIVKYSSKEEIEEENRKFCFASFYKSF